MVLPLFDLCLDLAGLPFEFFSLVMPQFFKANPTMSEASRRGVVLACSPIASSADIVLTYRFIG
jgi:hypothetical protein